MTGEFPAHRASKEENVSIWWRHHGIPIMQGTGLVFNVCGHLLACQKGLIYPKRYLIWGSVKHQPLCVMDQHDKVMMPINHRGCCYSNGNTWQSQEQCTVDDILHKSKRVSPQWAHLTQRSRVTHMKLSNEFLRLFGFQTVIWTNTGLILSGHSWEQIWINYSRKLISKCRLQKGDHLVQASGC